MAYADIHAESDYSEVIRPMEGDFEGKSLLSMHQLSTSDITKYIEEAQAAEKLIQSPDVKGINLLAHYVLKSVMRQPSTRTGGSMTTAIMRLGGAGELISGMASSSEAKGETIADSWLAFAAQSDILGIRTPEKNGPMYAASVIGQAVEAGKLYRNVPVINLGDGQNEHPTQTLGDIYTINKFIVDRLGKPFDETTLTLVGDHERYRAFHSLMIGAKTLGMKVVAVESEAASVPNEYIELLDDRLERVNDLDSAMPETDILYVGRKPDEYTDEANPREVERSDQLTRDYANWRIDQVRLQQMPQDSIVLHPRPRRDEINKDADADPRMRDVSQMEKMVPVRMAVIALMCGRSIKTASEVIFSER